MMTLLASLVLGSSFSFAQQASPTYDKLQAAASGVPAGLTYDGSKAAAPIQAVDGSTQPVTGGDDIQIVATPVVKVKPREVIFEKWAAGEGGKIGLKWGIIGGIALGALATGLLAGPIGIFGALGIGLLVAGLAALTGYLVGKHMGAQKAKELKGTQ